MSSKSKRGVFAAAVALLALAGPVTAQTSMTPRGGQIVVQNNREQPVRVYLDTRPFERRIGEVQPFETAEIPLPERALR